MGNVNPSEGEKPLGAGAHLAWVCQLEWRQAEDGPWSSVSGGWLAGLSQGRPSDEEFNAARFEWARACAKEAGGPGRRMSSSGTLFDGDDPPAARGSAHFFCSVGSLGLMSQSEALERLGRMLELGRKEMLAIGCDEPEALREGEIDPLRRGELAAARACAERTLALAARRELDGATGPGRGGSGPRL